jgi:cobalt-zinc-cadmium efflux system membrane fusion protein
MEAGLNRALLSLVLLAGVAGCGQSPAPTVTQASAAKDSHAHDSHSHEGWWCDEHGMPEEVCAQCNAKVAAEFKAKGDWCKEHDRPESQCFICHPEKEAEFAALYQAKFGANPPLLK